MARPLLDGKTELVAAPSCASGCGLRDALRGRGAVGDEGLEPSIPSVSGARNATPRTVDGRSRRRLANESESPGSRPWSRSPPQVGRIADWDRFSSGFHTHLAGFARPAATPWPSRDPLGQEVATPDLDIETQDAQERRRLLERLWDSLSRDEISLTSAQREEPDRRLDALERDGAIGIPWDEVLRRIRHRDD